MTSYQTKLTARQLAHRFGALQVLSDINLTVAAGQFVSLLGVSGSGKSTILNIIAGLIQPERGEVFIDGDNVTGQSGRVSYMYQKDLLLPWRTVIDNVALPLVVGGTAIKEARQQVAELFDIFGLAGFEKHYPNQLSGGMRQRVALMRTYVFSGDIMLLDEPFGGLDAITRNKMHVWLLETLTQLDATILLVTHDIDEALLLSDQIYIISQRPAIINQIIDVPFTRPRAVSLETDPRFIALKKDILSELLE